MKIVHVIAGLEITDGGPFQTLPQLWSHLSGQGLKIEAFTTAMKEDVRQNAKLPYQFSKSPRGFPSSIKRSPQLAQGLAKAMPDADLCHNHGCWLYPNWAAASIARRFQKPLVISPLGHLDAWSLKHRAWRKRIIARIVERANWEYASAFVAKSNLEADQIKSLGFKARIEVVPNGLDVDEWRDLPSRDIFLEAFPQLRNKKLILFLSRIHPKKGVFPLLNVWKTICSKFPDWQLVIAGGRSSYSRKIEHWLSNQDFTDRVTFTGTLDADIKKSALASSSLFVLPSFSENFAQVVLEAFAAGLPVITTKGCPWSGIESNRCGWWIEMEENFLRDALVSALNTSSGELREMGRRGQQWIMRDFDWNQIARRMSDLYIAVLSNGIK